MQKIKSVAVVGGTHGNERTGVEILKHWNAPSNLSFDIPTLLANPLATERSVRYIDKDLNRCFLQKDLERSPKLYEEIRAKEVEKTLGGRNNPKSELIIDIHNSTAAMGISLIVGVLDPFMNWILSRALEATSEVKIYLMEESNRNESPYLPSLAPYDICLEVGPQAHGTIVADLYNKTVDTLTALLTAVEDWNCNRVTPQTAYHYKHLRNLDYPRSKDGEISAMIHPKLQGRDYAPLHKGDPLFLTFTGETIFWQEDTVWPVFINEAAYYEKGIAMSLTQLIAF